MKTQTPNQSIKGKVILDFLPGPVKIKDGLFMGDEVAAKVIFTLHRISNLSSAIRSPMSSTQSQKKYLTYGNDLASTTYQLIGLKISKMYFCHHQDLRQKKSYR